MARGGTVTSPSTHEFGWDVDFDEVGWRVGVPFVHTTHVCLDMHNGIAQLLGLPLIEDYQRVAALTTTASS